MDVATGMPVEAEVTEHLGTCSACGERLESLRQTMSLLEEWKAPEPSPYFDTRLHARLREEAARPRGIFGWLRKPALAATVAALMTIGVLTFYHGSTSLTNQPIAQAEAGTAVGDLQRLDKNNDVLANFDILDDLEDMDAESQPVNR